MGRRPIGDDPMTAAQRQARRRGRQAFREMILMNMVRVVLLAGEELEFSCDLMQSTKDSLKSLGGLLRQNEHLFSLEPDDGEHS
jgi:hypothetical protein